MLNKSAASNITAPTRFLDGGKERYAYRRFGAGSGRACSTSRERWTIGIQPSPIRLRANGR
jgi:hypothetical protein